jgi:hypothetical protein
MTKSIFMPGVRALIAYELCFVTYLRLRNNFSAVAASLGVTAMDLSIHAA